MISGLLNQSKTACPSLLVRDYSLFVTNGTDKRSKCSCTMCPCM